MEEGNHLDVQPSYDKSKDYWDHIEPTVDGMLGGFAKISSIDAHASVRFLENFMSPLVPSSSNRKRTGDGGNVIEVSPPSCPRTPRRALDCGAGIGRVTKTLLLKFFDTVDLLEQSQTFLDSARDYLGTEIYDKRIGKAYCSGLQDFEPEVGVEYDVIWCQWVTGYLTDDDFVNFLKKCKSILKPGEGLIMIKDNHTSNDNLDADMSDSSITRSYKMFLKIFERSELTLVKETRQTKFPKGLYPVKLFALR
ncbi:N-terminal Xaa-Pro-Lys N-methyltransferase 1 [Halotydeus destructor]|nr:N-terminal Xaa-Pro-Lys N-methyltransferase 1 [Halotydeus destructor]